jgi:exodeoxyribonuclease V alpha subunit
MQVENDYDKDVYNGNLGVVSRIDMEEASRAPISTAAKSSTALASLMNWCSPTRQQSTRGQGSEYPAVVIPLMIQNYPMLQRNLVYTGVTRGKRLVVIIGQRKALAIAVKGVRTRDRWSKLREG